MISPEELDQMTEEDILGIIGQGEVFMSQMPAVGAEIEHLKGYLAGRRWAAAHVDQDVSEESTVIELVE